MFANVIHEHGELKINPNCYLRIIYDYIREQLDIPLNREFDLYSEDGSACFIYRHAPDTDGKTILKPRQTYRLEMFQIDKESEGSAASEVAEAEAEPEGEAGGGNEKLNDGLSETSVEEVVNI